MTGITFDIEANNLLNEESIDYSASPYVLKDTFKIHCIVVEEHETGKLIAFYDGDTYILDGREYEETCGKYDYVLKDYEPIEYEHRQLDEFPEYIEDHPFDRVVAHNGINYDFLVCKLYFGMDYSVVPDTWAGKKVIIEDTMVTSKTLNPDRFCGHSLDKLAGLANRSQKVEFRKHVPQQHRFKYFAADMLHYNIFDVKANTAVYNYLEWEKDDWDWEEAIQLEKAVAEIITRQEHRGFWFDNDLAEKNVAELDKLMEERRERVEPLLPPRPATKAFEKEYTPPARQVKKNGDAANDLIKFVTKHGGSINDDVTEVTLFGETHSLPLERVPLKTEMPATIDNTTHIKNWLVGLGWEPSEYKDKDLTLKSGSKIRRTEEELEKAIDRYVEETYASNFKADRLKHLEMVSSTKAFQLKSRLARRAEKRSLKVLTNPSFTVGQEKELCPDLDRIAEEFPYVKDIVEYLTYKHRRNSILGGGLDWEEGEEAEKGYLANIRPDGRIGTPADTCGAATSRMKHKKVANVPRVTSLYGKLMRALFGVDRKKCLQIGYDFDSLEARIEAHYCVPTSAQALTKNGWKYHWELSEGDLVLGYNAETGLKEWTEVEGKVFYENSDTYTIEAGRQSYRATGDHRWYVEQRNTTTKTYDPCVRTTDQLNTGTKIIVNAPFNKEQDKEPSNAPVSKGKYDCNWTQRVLNMSHQERKCFLEGFLIADGYWHKHKQKPVWRWAQNEGEHFEAALLASYLVHDGNVTVADNDGKGKVKVVTLCNNARITGQKLKKTYYGKEDVWCPQTKLGSWVMRQGNCITITGNCWRYDGDKEYCQSLTLPKPFDVHTKMAEAISEIIHKKFERDPAKSVKYGCTYGAQEAKVAKTIGSDLVTGKLVFDAFWTAAMPLKRLKEALARYWKNVGGKKFILGIDGRKVPTRAEHAILNSLFQSGGVICAKRTMVYHDRLLKEEGYAVDFFEDDWKNADYCQQLIAYHDECQLEESKKNFTFKVFDTEEEAKQYRQDADKVWSEPVKGKGGKWVLAYSRAAELIQKAVDLTTEHYKLNVPLTAGYIVGYNWRDCH